MSLWDTISGYGSSLGQDFRGGFGNLSPGYAGMTPEQQKAAAYANIANWGGGVLAGGNRGAGNLGTGLRAAQQQALTKNRGRIADAMLKDQQDDAKERRKRLAQSNAAWSQGGLGAAVAKSIGLSPEQTPAFIDMGMPDGLSYAKQFGKAGSGTAAMKNFNHLQSLIAAGDTEGAEQFKKLIAKGGVNVYGNVPKPMSIPGHPDFERVWKPETESWEVQRISGLPQAPPDEDAARIQLQKEGTARDASIMLRESDRVLDLVEEYPTAAAGPWARAAVINPRSPAAKVAEAISTMRAKIGFTELKRMRSESKSGGALGNVTIGEIERLEKAITSLNQFQDPEVFRQNVIYVQELYQDMQRKVMEHPEGNISVLGGVEFLSNRGAKASFDPSGVTGDRIPGGGGDALYEKWK